MSFKAQLPEGATVAPVILASDATKLSEFRGDQAAWPVYLSVGNINKEKRRNISSHAMILLAYIPTTKLECYRSSSRTLAGQRLFHHCMDKVLNPLVEAGEKGVVMVCADGQNRLVFPILAAYIADHPEQCLVADIHENFCPRGIVQPDDRGEPTECFLRNVEDTIECLQLHQDGFSPTRFVREGLREVYEPFWKHLPHCNIFSCITPDILHQLHKGMFKTHLVSWCLDLIGKEELDRQFMAVPDAPGLRHFQHGISHVKQWTGSEQKDMERVFVPLIAGAVPEKVLVAAQAIVDFICFARCETHTTATLEGMRTALQTFHHNKDVFIDLGLREDFNFPKLHSMIHYVEAILRKGSLDGYNTELPERLHIEYAKDAYRAGNRRDYIAHMTTWLQRQEAVDTRSRYLEWADASDAVGKEVGNDFERDVRGEREEGDGVVVPDGMAGEPEIGAGSLTAPAGTQAAGDENTRDQFDIEENVHALHGPSPVTGYRIAKRVPYPRMTLQLISTALLATEFEPTFVAFIKEMFPGSLFVPSAIRYFRVFKQIRLRRPWNPFISNHTRDFNRVRASPAVPAPANSRKGAVPAQLDTIVVVEDEEEFSRRMKGTLQGEWWWKSRRSRLLLTPTTRRASVTLITTRDSCRSSCCSLEGLV